MTGCCCCCRNLHFRKNAFQYNVIVALKSNNENSEKYKQFELNVFSEKITINLLFHTKKEH